MSNKDNNGAVSVGMDGVSVSLNIRPPVEGVSAGENTAPSQVPLKKQAVKRHHHKHNLKHRYEFLETLGKGTYGKVKKAKERSGRLVRIHSVLFITLYLVTQHICGQGQVSVFALLS